MDDRLELLYQESEFFEEEEEQAMMQHVSVAAAVMRLERGVALMELNGTQIGAQMSDESEAEESNRDENGMEQQEEQTEVVVKPVVTPTEEQWEIEKPNEFLRFFLRMGFGALLHPYEYTKVLMQLGHEPLPASKNFLGRSTLFLPSVHEYIRFIKHTDGIIGLYRGLGARFLSCASAAIFSESLVNMLGMCRYKRVEGEKKGFKKYAWNLLRDGIVVITGLVFSHPFYVISVRQMGQFVGREIVYSGICDSFREIVKQDGLMGLYAGFVPRLLCDLGVLVTTSTLSAICNRTFHLRSTQKAYNSVLFQFGAIMIFYPLQVVAACMACSGSGIAAGAPPFMPIYAQWTDCLMDLLARGDQLRGAFIFRRTLPRLQMHRLHDVFPISRMI
ncbi:mitochondrial carrier homolog 2 [Drosophila innubila]|uniref:mitochondrial carrier homolog 2 n=1 Tax=Drosophila innubila TaxID=198719 RepID=UPI00148C8359|nr:mitochondrial carrier homolog 2 [Drosophila innubila]